MGGICPKNELRVTSYKLRVAGEEWELGTRNSEFAIQRGAGYLRRGRPAFHVSPGTGRLTIAQGASPGEAWNEH